MQEFLLFVSLLYIFFFLHSNFGIFSTFEPVDNTTYNNSDWNDHASKIPKHFTILRHNNSFGCILHSLLFLILYPCNCDRIDRTARIERDNLQAVYVAISVGAVKSQKLNSLVKGDCSDPLWLWLDAFWSGLPQTGFELDPANVVVPHSDRQACNVLLTGDIHWGKITAGGQLCVSDAV